MNERGVGMHIPDLVGKAIGREIAEKFVPMPFLIPRGGTRGFVTWPHGMYMRNIANAIERERE